jgi:hypothetical protein
VRRKWHTKGKAVNFQKYSNESQIEWSNSSSSKGLEE